MKAIKWIWNKWVSRITKTYLMENTNGQLCLWRFELGDGFKLIKNQWIKAFLTALTIVVFALLVTIKL